jgi:hypothetical protein
MQSSREHVLVAKVTWRLIPMLFICYIIAYIDRINVGFAGLQLQKTFGVDTSRYYEIYGWGAGMFFLGYFIFEVPSNLILHKVGARLWITRIMLVWGVRFLSRHHPVSDILVSDEGSCAHRRIILDRRNARRIR